MKLNRYEWIFGAAMLCLVVSLVSANQLIVSNLIIGEVKPKPYLLLQFGDSSSSIYEGEEFDLLATITPAIEGKAISFYWNETNLIGIQSTNSLGVAGQGFLPSSVGFYNLTAQCEIP